MTITLDKTHVPPKDFIYENDSDEDFDDHYCIKVVSYNCPCGHTIRYVELGITTLFGIVATDHEIALWEEKDGIILHAATMCMNENLNPRIVQYEKSMGKAKLWEVGYDIVAQRVA